MLVFISHSSKDRWIARKIANDLDELGLGIEVFLDEKNIVTGGDINDTINSYLAKANDFLILLSASALKSEWVRKEYYHAESLKKNIIPILLCIDEIPRIIDNRLARDINDIEEYYRELKDRLANPVKYTTSTLHNTQLTPDQLFHPGDAVKIIPIPPRTKSSDGGTGINWVDDMNSYLGKDAKALSVNKDESSYVLDIDQGKYCWKHEWLIPLGN